LSIAAKIVQELGGSIRAEGNTPKGARFVLRLPLMDQVEQPAQDTGDTTPLTGTHS
jgi:signal transduction histidine kinase